ncbi:MAG: ATP-binding protein [Pseudomonadota bacterium]
MTFLRHAIRDRLGIRLVVATLLISTLFSAVAAGVQLYLSYQRQVGATVQVVDRVSATALEPLQNALWQFDFEQVDIILRGIQSDPAVAHVTLTSSTGHRFEYGEQDYMERQNRFELVHRLNGVPETIGNLDIYLSLEAIWTNLWAQFMTLIATNLIKAYLVAFALLVLYYRMVTRHLSHIARHIETYDEPHKPLDLVMDRASQPRPDAIDKIATALNGMSQRSVHQIDRLEGEVKQREAAEREAVKASQVRKRFLANMSHEVRTPLNAMMGLFQLIEMSDVPARQKQQAATGLDAAKVLLSQLTNVLEVSRLEANAVTLSPREVEIAPLARQWAEAARGTVKRYGKSLDVKVELADTLPAHLQFDDKRVTQIVQNLCDNAAKFSSVGALLIRVGLDPQDTSSRLPVLMVSVSDTGPGLSTEDARTAFERFAQVDDSLTRRHSGTGLGLSISADLAKLMGGQLEVESPSQLRNYTTTFTLRIPVHQLGEEAA